MFQNALLSVSSLFKYFDEVLALTFAICIILNSRRLKTRHFKILVLLGFLVLLGLISNVISGIDRSIKAIFLDILYFSKLYVCLIGAVIYFSKNGGIRSLTKALATEIHIFVICGLMLACLSQSRDLGMTHGYRYGFKSFQFIFSSPGMLSQYCIIYLLILTLDLDNRRNRTHKLFHVFLLFALWISTGRTRSLAVILVWLFVYVITNSRALNANVQSSAKEMFKKIMRPQYLLFAGIGVAYIGWDQIQYYLGAESNTARSLLLRGGMAVMKDRFPLGSGFATFGTEAAARYYSPLYYQYGLSSHWALKEGGGELTDCLWPAVGAEFGIIGLLLLAILVWKVSRELIHLSEGARYPFIASVTYVAYLLISSTATSIYTAYTTTAFVVLFVGLLIDYKSSSEGGYDGDCNIV